MSTITTHSSQELVSTLLSHFSPVDEKTLAIQLDEDRAVIAVLPEKRASSPTGTVESFEERKRRIIERLRSRAVKGVGLSDWAVSREGIYSEDGVT